MRQKHTDQRCLFDQFAEHQTGREMSAMSALIDDHIALLDLFAADLGGGALNDTGRRGLTVESVVRCAVLKQLHQVSYEKLAFLLEDSMSFRSFARLGVGVSPKKSVLQKTISAISPETWEQFNRALVLSAKRRGIDNGTKIRIDSTAVDALLHKPTDSSLLLDGVRVMTRLLEDAAKLPGVQDVVWRNHMRVAKRRALAILNCRGKDKKAGFYRDLVKVTESTADALEQMLVAVEAEWSLEALGWISECRHYLPLIRHVISQTRRRVFEGESVPAKEKIVSLFEDHSDIIAKGKRQIQFGHKLNLTTGASGLILDAVVEDGNPADAARFIPMIERQIELYGKAPRQVAADAGYASKANLAQARELGLKAVAFHAKRGMTVALMGMSKAVYRRLRNFRAGIEAGISHLKRCFGLSRCTWRGLQHFRAYVWSSVVAFNLSLLARLSTT